MATKSILKSIRLKEPGLCRSFVSALENSENKRSIDVRYSRMVRDVDDKEQIRKLLSEPRE